MKATRYLAAGVLSFCLVVGVGTAFSAQSGTVAQGNISVYQGGQLVERLTGQNPVTDESLLVCNGKCLVKTKGVSLIGVEGTRLAIKNDKDIFNLLVNKGRVDFVITGSVSKIAFYTPQSEYTIADIMLNASTHQPVRGYMNVSDDGRAEIGVTEGRMVFSTADGAKTVGNNDKIILAMADVGPGEKAGGALLGGEAAGAAGFSTATLVGGGVVVAAVAVGIIASNNDDDDDSPAAQPVTSTTGEAPAPQPATVSSSTVGGGGGVIPSPPPVASPSR